MSARLEELLLRWEDQRRDGKPVSADDLCHDCPELLDELRAHVTAIQKMDQLLDLSETVDRGVAPESQKNHYDDLRAGWEPIPDYRLEKLLGKGGFGEVWKAVGPGGFAVALKFVPLSSPLGTSELRSLDVLKTVHHPNLLTIFGAWQAHGFLIVAMEKADKTLLDRLTEATTSGTFGIPGHELIKYVEDIARGLDYLNQPDVNLADSAKEAIQHRDIKPQNIFLMGGGIKIGDFGLMRVLKKTVTDHTGSLTLSYAPPEFFQGHTARSSDQYSLAITYCQLRGGRLPFVGNPGQIMEGHLKGTPDLTMLPVNERPAVDRALQKDPHARWPTCADFVRALVLDGSLPTSSLDERSKLARVLPIGSFAALLIIAAILIARSLDARLNKGPAVSAGGKEEPKSNSGQPTDAEAFVEQGKAFYADMDYDKAIADYTEAIRLDPKLADAYAHRAHAHLTKGEEDEAIADSNKALELDSKSFWALYSRGFVQNHKREFDKAIDDFSKAIQISPTYSPSFYGRGNAYAGNNDLKRAIADYTEAIRLDPSFVKPLRMRSAAYKKQGQMALASADLQQAQRIERTQPSVPRPDPPPNLVDELKRIQGKWIRKSAIKGEIEQYMPPPVTEVVFTEKEMVYDHHHPVKPNKLGKQRKELPWTFTIDPTTSPKRLDRTQGNKVVLGIYKLEGEHLTYAFSAVQLDKADKMRRPTAFTSPPGSEVTVQLYKRK